LIDVVDAADLHASSGRRATGEHRLLQPLAGTHGACGLHERGGVGAWRLHARPHRRDRARRDQSWLELEHDRLDAPLVCHESRHDRGAEPGGDESLHRGSRRRFEHETRVDAVDAKLFFHVIPGRFVGNER
jgi:hypothetical protein